MLGALIGAGASLLGGWMGQKSAKEQQEKNIALQKEFAQSGIQWKVADAKAAGIHPLAALGAQTHSYSPVTIGDPMGQAVANAGQDISRAINAGSSASGQARQYAAAVQGLDLQNRELQNQLLASQIARMRQQMNPPIPSDNAPMVIDGQGNSILPPQFLPGAAFAQGGTGGSGRRRGGTGSGVPGINIENFDLPWTAPGNPHVEPAANPDLGFTSTAGGGLAPVMSRPAQERLEDDWPGMIWWNIRNRVVPGMSPAFNPSNLPTLPAGQRWRFNPVTGEYYRQTYRGYGFWH